MSEQPNRRFPAILETVGHYYTEKLRAFGATPRGVDWNSADSQTLRFDRLLQVLDNDGDASINDYGCGYGALVWSQSSDDLASGSRNVVGGNVGH